VEFVEVCNRGEVPEGGVRTVKVAGRAVALCNVGGEILAVDDVCPHAGGSLGRGRLEGETLVCPLHRAQFNVRTGEALGGPTTEALATYPVQVSGDLVRVALSA
jgi:nitrite reductase/ring-hydroxylating ferredoxin subunit